MSEQTPNAPRHHRYAPLAFLGALAIVAAWTASENIPEGFSGVLSWWFSAGWPAIACFLSGIGLGAFYRTSLARWGLPRELQSALGLITLVLITGVQWSFFGGLGDRGFLWLSWITLVPGFAGMVLLFRNRTPRDTHSPWRLLAFAPVGFLLAAACAPPGWLYGSEGGGYDSLSYHLQLPHEWIVSKSGRIEPFQRNLFSYFPSFVEGAFAHLGAMSGATRDADVTGARGLIADGGWRLLSCQMLHVLMAIHAAWMLGALVRTVGVRAQISETAREWAVACARLLVLATPWFVVSGSLSYNEMPMLTCIAAALIAVLHVDAQKSNHVALGVVLGILVGGAAGVKPTGGVFLGVPLAVLCLRIFPVRRWMTMAIPGVVALAVVLSPWIIRNAMHGSNPIFPFALNMFGGDHWDTEQIERFTRSVSFDGSWADRLRLMFFSDPTDPGGVRHRGLMHPQWMWFFPIVVVGILLGCRRQLRDGTMPLVLFAGIQLALWLSVTHIQSRFLLPLVPPLAAACAIGIAVLPRGVLWAIVVAMAARGVATFNWYHAERGGQANAFLAFGPSYFTGHHAADVLKIVKTPEERDEAIAQAPPSYFARRSGFERVLLIGESAALYWNDPVYSTTWDRNPLAEAFMTASSDDPQAVNDVLRGRGVQFVFVSESELDRLSRSGLLDPNLSPARLSAWLSGGVEPIRVWPESRCYLVKLKSRENP